MLKQLFCSSLLFVSFLSFSENLNIENQYNTLDNMFSGDYSTQLTVNEAMKQNNNFGIGLAKELGELIVIDNKYYVADSKGNAKLMKGNDGISYLTATNFDSDNALHFEIKKPMTLIKIQNLINKEVKITHLSENLISRQKLQILPKLRITSLLSVLVYSIVYCLYHALPIDKYIVHIRLTP